VREKDEKQMEKKASARERKIARRCYIVREGREIRSNGEGYVQAPRKEVNNGFIITKNEESSSISCRVARESSARRRASREISVIVQRIE
jgi:hypothetical protein